MFNFWAIFIVSGIIFFVIILIFYIFIRKLHKALKKPEKEEKILHLKCLDGHLVRSKGELIIDNYRYFLGLNHKYEKTIKIYDSDKVSRDQLQNIVRELSELNKLKRDLQVVKRVVEENRSIIESLWGEEYR